MNIMEASTSLERTMTFLKKSYNQNKFDTIILQAQELAYILKVDNCFPIESARRERKRKRFFDEREIIEENLCQNVFDKMFECATKVIKDRFEAFQAGIEPFKFLFDIKSLSLMPDEDIKICCNRLETKLTEGTKKDISGAELHFELKSLSSQFCENLGPEKSLKFLYENNLNEIYANVSVALRILLTLPITVACAERSFSKLKIIKNYLRSSMSQDRLNNLATISIESDIVNDLNIEDLRLKFSRMKARKAFFSK